MTRLLAALLCLAPVALADDWPQWLGPKRDGVWREPNIIEKLPEGGPKVLWRVPVGMGYSGPAVAGDRLYLMDRVLAKGQANPANAFAKTAVQGTDRVLCFDAATGKQVWHHDYESEYRVSYAAGPRVTPTVDGDRVYTLGTMGELFCLNAKDGKPVWAKNFLTDFGATVPFWGYSGAPLIDGDKVICTVGAPTGKGVVAFDKATGKELWSALSMGDAGYSPPMIYEFGKLRHLIIWHPKAVHSLDPETGKVRWKFDFEVKQSLTAPTPIKVGDDRLFVSAFYDGSRMLKVSDDKAELSHGSTNASEKPDKTDGLHAIIAKPVFADGFIYGVGSYGELRCLDAATGERKWATLAATTAGEPVRWATAFLTPCANGKWFLFNENGELIIAELTPKGYTEISRAKVLEPLNKLPGRPVVWSHPAYAHGSMFARNDRELVRVELKAK